MTKWLAIVNPAAGGGRCGERADEALETLRRGGMTIDVVRTESPGHATTLARDAAASGRTHFLAVGGDGTTFEILNGLFPRREGGEPPTVAMLPLGTGNSFLRDFGIEGAEAAMAAILRAEEHPCDVLRIDHARGVLHSINIVGVGFSADVGALTNRRYKHLGAAGYVVAVLRTAIGLRSPTFPLRIDGGALDARPAILLSFCNSRCTAGTMRMAPNAEVSDGMLDVIRIGPRSRLSFVSAFPSIFAGRHVQKEGVEEARAKRVELELDHEVDTMIDGEVLPLRLRSIEVVPGALRVIA
ncbi:diacylglycerol/lipid kinase family protein [Sandaracinus amylolyticus]|uniref:diacylglycerol/lipid kinase family protein n=1 Tax=Sandaracinus amylolyticus TaxID=927083 RepID=UPI00069E0C1F|nr:diacylglycerol kinase family protein [Sandaracinus amylolyticus]